MEEKARTERSAIFLSCGGTVKLEPNPARFTVASLVLIVIVFSTFGPSSQTSSTKKLPANQA